MYTVRTREEKIMHYVSLARKYRPQKFLDLIGQESIARTLEQAFAQKRLAQAYLFSGTRGVGKTSAARILARACCCLGEGHQEGQERYGTPCGECANCKEAYLDRCLDIQEIDGASNNSVENVRDLISKVNHLPSRGKKRVYIIDEVHMLSNAAFNALLKTLEEPPSHIVFILATTEIQKVPATIVSRCQSFDFQNVGLLHIKKHLEDILTKESIPFSDQATRIVASHAEGSLRDALSTLDQVLSFHGGELNVENVLACLGKVKREILFSIIEHIFSKDTFFSSIKLMQESLEEGSQPKQIAKDLCELLRDLLFYRQGAPREMFPSLQEESFEQCAQNISSVSTTTLQAAFAIWMDSVDRIGRSPLPKAQLEMTAMKVNSLDLVSLQELCESTSTAGSSSCAKEAAQKKAPSPEKGHDSISSISQSTSKEEAANNVHTYTTKKDWSSFLFYLQSSFPKDPLCLLLKEEVGGVLLPAEKKNILVLEVLSGIAAQRMRSKSNFDRLNKWVKDFFGAHISLRLEEKEARQKTDAPQKENARHSTEKESLVFKVFGDAKKIEE